MLYNSKKYALKDSKIPSEIESEAGIAEVVEVVKKTNSDKEMRARIETARFILALYEEVDIKKAKKTIRKN